MIYAYDQAVQYPVKDLYDNLIMLASIQTAKDMYEKGLLELKDFKKEYGDFFSPIAKDMDWYSLNVTGKVQNAVNYLYENGIDPLRSAEGRSFISKVINSVDVQRIARNKVSALNAIEWLKNRDQLAAQNLWDEDYERFASNGETLDTFSSENGIWLNTSPHRYSTMRDLVHPSLESIQPHLLKQEDVEALGYTYDPAYDYTGVTKEDVGRAIDQLISNADNNSMWRYYKEQARQQLIREGNTNPDDNAVMARLRQNAMNSDYGIQTPFKATENPYQYIKAKADEEIREYSATTARYGGGRGGGYGGGNRTSRHRKNNIFDAAYSSLLSNRTKNNNMIGDWREFSTKKSLISQHIAWGFDHPVDVTTNGAGIYGYRIPKDAILFNMRTSNNNAKALMAYMKGKKYFTFVPTGKLRAIGKKGSGDVEYHIQGKIAELGDRLFSLPVIDASYDE